MNYYNTKSTKRFTYGIARNSTSHQAGANTLTIATNPSDGQYSVGQSAVTMTVREAQALRTFLNTELSESEDASTSVV